MVVFSELTAYLAQTPAEVPLKGFLKKAEVELAEEGGFHQSIMKA